MDDVPKQDYDPADLSIHTLSADLVALLRNLYPDPKEAPSLIVCPHCAARLSEFFPDHDVS